MVFMAPSKSTKARTMGLVPRARELATLSPGDSWEVVKNAFKPLKGAPVIKRKSSSPSLPPLFTKVWVCSLSRSALPAPTFSIRANKL